MAIDTANLLARICAIEEAATLAIGFTTHAVPRWLYQQEKAGYWRNRIATAQLDTSPNDDGQEVDSYIYTIETALVYANASAGYNGEKDEDILAIFPQLVQYFDEREVLQSALFPTGTPFLRMSYFIAGQGYVTFPVGTAGGVQIGSTFTWRCIFDRFITQAY